MKLLLFASLVFFTGCVSTKVIPIKGTYPETPIIINSTKTFDQAWDKLIDIFAQKGLSIRIIDRSSGLIISDKSELSTTYENETGKPVDETAFIVVSSVIQYGKKVPVTGTSSGAYAQTKVAYPARGDWNVRIKSNAGGGCSINVNITNITYNAYDLTEKRYRDMNLAAYKSTGVFENLIASMINQ